MIVHDELYVILNGSRRKIEIKNPSGISLKFQSNMFNDLSKFCASYSYTFKIPKTKNNVDAFDLIDEIRHPSSAYGKKIRCELYRDGIKLFDNSYLYINEGGSEYSAVITWNVLSWLLEINESGKSIKDIEKDFEGENITTVEWEGGSPYIDNPQSMSDSSIMANYRSGRPVVYRSPKLVPVRYLLNKISRYFGKGDATDIFSFLRPAPLTNDDFRVAETSFNIADDGVIPLVNGKWSNNYLQTQIRRCDKFMAKKYGEEFTMLDRLGKGLDTTEKSDVILYNTSNKQFLFFGDVTGVPEYVTFYKHTGTATISNKVFVNDEEGNDTDKVDLVATTWNKDETANGMYAGFSASNSKNTFILRGRIRVNDFGRLQFIPYVKASSSVYAPMMDEEGKMQNVIEVDSNAVEGESGLFEYNFDPEQGGVQVEFPSLDGVEFWVAQFSNYNEVFVVDGYFKFLPQRDNITSGYVEPEGLSTVDLFFNLPDIKIIDLLKSLFFIENAYPFIEKDGRIGQMRYDDLYRNIRDGKVYDWSNILVGSPKDDTVRYTNGNLGRINRINMKNYSVDGKSDDETALRYEEASSYFQTDNEYLQAENTIFTFPFASASLVTKDGFSAGGTFIFWERDNGSEYNVAGSVDPIIGRVRSSKEGNLYHFANEVDTLSISEYLKFSIWQVASKDYDNTVLAEIFRKPYVIETKAFIDTFTLSRIDFTMPVYLSRYNAYFGLISIQSESNGMSKVELIKLPNISLSDMGSKSDPEIEIIGSPVVFKKSGIDAISYYTVNASVKGARINRMVVSVDGTTIADDDMEVFKTYERFESGTHLIEVTAYASNGRSKTEYFETRVVAATEGLSIDFVKYSSGLVISNTKPNIATFKVALYNSNSIGSLRLSKFRKGYDEKILLGSTTEKELEVEWEYFEQLGTNGTNDVTWGLIAEFDSATEHTSTTKDVTVSVDKNILRYYDGIVSGMYFQIAGSRTYREGSYIEGAFEYGDFTASFMVVGAQVPPYYLEFHFVCYIDGGSSSYEYIHRIDPYDGSSAQITLPRSRFGSYQRIKAFAVARFYAKGGNTYYTSDHIWFYRDKQS